MSINKRILWMCSIVMILMLTFIHGPVYAAAKQSEIITTTTQEDLTVMFTFDKEVVDIIFLSPSGERKTAADSDVTVSSGDLWSTYRISNAEVGKWSVEYDLGSNSEISYSVIEDNYGLWLQYLDLKKVSDEKVALSFEADFNDDNVYYGYEIYAISTIDSQAISKISDGNAKANEEKTVEVDLSRLSSDVYVFRVDAYYQDDTAELFDSLESKQYDYTNPNEPTVIDDYKVFINADEFICNVDWSDYTNWSHDEYKIIVNADGENIYKAELENSVANDSILYSSGTKNLEIYLAYKDNGIWSAYKEKEINLENEMLNNVSGEVTNSSEMEIAYKVNKERSLYVSVNGEEGNYKIKEEGTLAFNLIEGNNTVYAQIESDDLIYYIIDTSVYFDAKPPAIILFDDLDGKTFYSDSVTLIGRMAGGNILRIVGEEVPLSEDGVFSYEVKLSLGENVIEMEAEDANGNISLRILTLYKGSTLLNNSESKKGWIQFLPLLASALTSALVIVLSIAFMKKNVKVIAKKKNTILVFVVWDMIVGIIDAGCIWQFVKRYLFSNSMGYFELAERSASDAAKYLRLKRFFGIASGAWLIVLVISIFVTVLMGRHYKRKKQEGVR